jgi:hypothetical protein
MKNRNYFMKFKIIISLCFVLLYGCNSEIKEAKENGKIDTLVVSKYKDGKVKLIQIRKEGRKISNNFFDRNGVLLNEGFENKKRKLITYYEDTLVFEETFLTVFKEKDGNSAQTDSVLLYSHSPHSLVLKYIKKDDKTYFTRYKNSKPVGYDTFVTKGNEMIIDQYIKRVKGKDTLVGYYYPDLNE